MAKDKPGKAGKGLPALDRSPSHLLHRAVQVALDLYAEELGAGAITQRQYAVLAAVESQEGLTQTDLVRMTGIDRSTLADMVARMIAKGLIERQRSETDARANAVHLTEAGRVALTEAQPKVARADARLLKLLSPGKRDALTAALRDLTRVNDPTADKIEKPPKADKPKKAEKPKKKKPKKLA